MKEKITMSGPYGVCFYCEKKKEEYVITEQGSVCKECAKKNFNEIADNIKYPCDLYFMLELKNEMKKEN
jgi:GR25 family glycosyltransferase involved in LPS biosynthesis